MYEQEVRDWLRSNYTGQQNIDEIEITPELKRRYIRHLTTPGIKPEDVNTELTTTEKIAQSAPVKFAGDLGAGTMQGLSGAVKGADWISGLMGVRPQLPPELEAQRPSTVKDITDLLARQYAKSSEMGFDEGSIPKYVSQGLGHAAVSVPLMSAVGIVPYSMATGGGEAAAEGKSDIGQFANAAYSGAIGLVQDRILHGIGKKELSVIPRQLLGGAAMAGVPIVAETAMKIQQGQDPTDIDWKKVTADFIQGALFPLGSKKKSPTYKDRAAELAELQKRAEIEFGERKPTKLEEAPGPRVIGQGEGGNVSRPPVSSVESLKKDGSGGVSKEGTLYASDIDIKNNTRPGEQIRDTLITAADFADAKIRANEYGDGTILEDATGIRWRVQKGKRGSISLEQIDDNGIATGGGESVIVYGQWKNMGLNIIARSRVVDGGGISEPGSGPKEYVAVGDRKQHKVKIVDEQPQVNAGDPLLGEGLVTETKKINDVSARELHGNGRTVIKSISNTSKEKGAGTDFMIGEIRSEHAKGNTVVSDSFATSKQAYDMYKKINEAHGTNSAAPEFDLRIVGKNESGGDRVEIFKIGDKRAEQFQPFEKTVKAEAPTPPTMNKRSTPEVARPADMAAQPDSLPPQEMMPDGMKIRQTATNTLFKEHGSRIMDMLGPEKFYPPETIEGWINEANKRMTTDGTDAAIKRLMEKPQFDHLDNVEAMIISGELNKANTPEAAQSMTDLAIKQAQMGTETGRALAAMRAIDVLNAPATVAARIFREAQKRFGKKAPELTPELTKKLMQMAEEAAKMPDGGERDVAIGRILAEIQGRVPRTMWKKLSTVQAISQLLNAKTFIRNLIGNVGLNAGEVVSHYIGMPIDAALAKVTGNRSVALPKFNKYVNEFVNGLKQGVRDVSRGVNTARSNLERRTGIKIPNELKNTFEFSAGETFKGNTIWGKLEKAVGYSLQASDRAFFEARFWDSADNIMRATKTNKFTPEIVEQALHEASRVTFRDANTVSNVLVAVKNALNKVGSKGGEFGLGELVLKYPKVPGAIIKRGIEYSPFGIFESAFKIGRVLKAGNKASMADQRSAALSSARTIIGTALAALGYGLAKAGAASGDRPDNQKLAKFEEAIGKRPYSIKSGKGWFSYDWLQPLATPFTMGVAVAERKEADRRGQSILRQIANYLPDMMASAGSSITEQPVMTGISRFASGDRYGENSGFTGGLINAIAGAPSSFTPTIFGQIAATIDPKKRKIPKDFSGRMLALVANRVPFLSKTLSERKSVLGEDLKRGTGNVLADAALNLVSPAIYSKIKDDPNVDFISQLYSETKDTNVLPRQAQRTITHKNKVYELTEDQQMELQGRVAELALERLSKMISGINFDSISKEGKIRIAKRVYDYAGSTAREEMLKIMKRNEINELLESSQ